MKYALWVSDDFMRALAAELREPGAPAEWHLFCPAAAPGLNRAYGPAYSELRRRYAAEGRAAKVVRPSAIIRAAFAWARAHGKTRVCMSDKSNAMRFTGGLWQRVFKAVAAEYPEIQASHLYVDVLAMEMVRAPERFEVIVTSNLFGDIITDLGAILQGGIGLACSGNIHPGRVSLFEPVHGSAPDIAGKGIANPMATFLTAGQLLSHLGRPALEAQIQAAVRGALLADEVTPELGGALSTRAVADAVLGRL
jgi:3-isopropylmalate dehydrogenase